MIGTWMEVTSSDRYNSYALEFYLSDSMKIKGAKVMELLKKRKLYFLHSWELVLHLPDHTKHIRLKESVQPTVEWCEEQFYSYVHQQYSRYKPVELLTSPKLHSRMIGRALMGEKHKDFLTQWADDHAALQEEQQALLEMIQCKQQT